MAASIPGTDPDSTDQNVRDVLLAHEDSGNGKGQTIDQKEMDVHNNDVGIALGRRAAEEGWSSERLEQEVYDKVNNTDGTGRDGTPFWYDKAGDPERKPPVKDVNATVGDELRQQWRQAEQYPPQDGAPHPDEVDPESGKKFGEMRAGEYAAALYRKRARESAGGSVHVRAYTRNDGSHVSAHDRQPPRQ